MINADTTIFESLESNVRGYCRAWPTVFTTAKGSWLRDEEGRTTSTSSQAPVH